MVNHLPGWIGESFLERIGESFLERIGESLIGTDYRI
jgi:hypothetical protein